ncbi:TPA: restriction endonuclease subunit S [Vibrio parahaemolyticus]|nr:restriction endonuclease subunit S [Vibrio parahaemolyticus]
MVSNGWTVKTLNDVSRITRLAGAEYSDVWETNSNGEIIALRGFNIGNNEVNLRDVERITQDMSLKLSRSKLYKNDIVFPCVGSIGKAYLVQEDNKFHINQNIAKLTPSDTVEPLFLTYCLLSKACVNQILKFNTSSSQPNVLVGNLRKFQFAFPQDRKEQRKIAQILSTWDRGIATTEKLIDASKQQKKALMQQLLTGKKRLIDPETGKAFEGEWEEVKLKQIGKCITGLTYSPNDVVDEGTLVLRSSNIQGGKLSFLDNVYVSSHIKEESKTRVGDILICVRNGSRNLIGKSAYITDKASGQAHGAFMTVFRGKYAEFVFQLFQTVQFHRQVNKNLGATINSINTSDLHKFKFDFPKDKNEIEKIASVLTAADKDIELLEAKLSHFKQEKKALMQQLLTGKRRVKVPETEAA